MKLKRYHHIAIIFTLIILVLNFIFFFNEDNMKIFYFITGLSLLILCLPFIFDIIYKVEKEKEKEEMFLEFLLSLSESVATGIPISKSIINISKRDYKSLDYNIKKLANQITLGIPLNKALLIFAKETENKVISRAIELIRQAETAGGKIESILESTVKSVREIQEINKKRAMVVHSMIVQGYIIFFIFLIIMIILQLKFIPEMFKIIPQQQEYQFISNINVEFLNNLIFFLILIQGFFAGIVIGKLSEGKILSGLKHSFILVAISFLIFQGVRLFLK
ncbi:MAG: type II secretion system F family protein [Candidatus Pacearchaeota archaeon]